MPNSAGVSSEQNDSDHMQPKQSKHRGRQTRCPASNQDWRQKQPQFVQSSAADMSTPVSSSNTRSWNGIHNVVKPGGQKRYQGRVKASNDRTSKSVQHSTTGPSYQSPQSASLSDHAGPRYQSPQSASLSDHAGPKYQSPSMPQSASSSHHVPRSTCSCL